MTRFYLSVNSTWDASDVLLAAAHAVPGLAEGTADTTPTTLTIPTGTGTGAYYVIAKADADNAVVEAKETNNTLSRAIQIGPDLDVSAFTGPAKGGAGLPLSVTDTTMNAGGGSSSTTTTTRFYLSVDSTVDAGDTLLGSRTLSGLAAGQASTVSTSLPIPAGTATGTYNLIAKADADNGVTETSETNNTYARSVRIGPDLSVTTLTASASTVAAGALVTITDKITNDGGGSAASTVTRFYLSANTILDATDVVLSANRSVPALAPLASSTGSTPLTIPAGTSPAKYYILAKADGDGAVAETSETDNVGSRSIQVTAP
jgi:subtilase family serine protease